MGAKGLEPIHPCGRQDLNLMRLPISPRPRIRVIEVGFEPTSSGHLMFDHQLRKQATFRLPVSNDTDSYSASLLDQNSWLREADLNRRHSDYESDALTRLSYPAKILTTSLEGFEPPTDYS